MQTFLPFPDFAASAAVLDRQRLGKQRVETMQIMKALLLPQESPPSIVGHPATKMWAGHEDALLGYQKAVCHEWVSVRGYRDTCLRKTWDLLVVAAFNGGRFTVAMPPWLGREDFHLAHRRMLLFKNYEHYRPHFPDDEPATITPGQPMPYIWPTKENS